MSEPTLYELNQRFVEMHTKLLRLRVVVTTSLDTLRDNHSAFPARAMAVMSPVCRALEEALNQSEPNT